MIDSLMKAGYPVEDMTDNELAKMHVRHMVGGRVTSGNRRSCIASNFRNAPARC